MKKLVFTVVAAFLTTSVVASDDAGSILESATGIWKGELYYLDYQSGQRFGIPMKIEASVTPDGATLVRQLTFTDPGNLVHAISLTTVDRDSGDLVEAYFREGKGEFSQATVTEMAFESETEWMLVYMQDGIDDNKPAVIRNTLRRDGNALTSSKEVRFAGETEFFLRNGFEVELTE